MLHVDFPTPLNFVCKKCIGQSGISSEIYTRKSSATTIRGDLQVGDVMVCEKSPRVEFWINSRNTKRYSCINRRNEQKVSTDFLTKKFYDPKESATFGDRSSKNKSAKLRRRRIRVSKRRPRDIIWKYSDLYILFFSEVPNGLPGKNLGTSYSDCR